MQQILVVCQRRKMLNGYAIHTLQQILKLQILMQTIFRSQFSVRNQNPPFVQMFHEGRLHWIAICTCRRRGFLDTQLIWWNMPSEVIDVFYRQLRQEKIKYWSISSAARATWCWLWHICICMCSFYCNRKDNNDQRKTQDLENKSAVPTLISRK